MKGITYRKHVMLLLAACCIVLPGMAEDEAGTDVIAIHSHNDYSQKTPFYGAYNAHVASIEADVFLADGEIYVSHNRKDIKAERTLKAMYLNPIREKFNQNGGKVYPDGAPLTLLVDLKDNASTLDAILKLIVQEYMPCFDYPYNSGAVRLVITGDKVPPSAFDKYPAFVYFDGIVGQTYTEEQKARIGMVSQSLGTYSSWKATSPLNESDSLKLSTLVSDAHQEGLKIRIWGYPDNERAWQTAINLGLDFINTDKPARVRSWLRGK